MRGKSIIIIGAGIAGLSTGCYGQMNGYRTRIFEMHSLPGGLCTAWKRRGRSSSASYTFDGCIEWLNGSKEGSGTNAIWRELGATQGRRMVHHDEWMRFEGRDGRTLVLYADADRLRQHLKELAPVDARQIDRLCNAIRRLSSMGEIWAGDSGFLGRIWAGLRMVPLLPPLIKYSKLSLEEFASRFSDPFLRESLVAITGRSDSAAIAIMVPLACMHSGDGGYAIGGSLEFATAIERRYLELGGEIRYRSRVAEILVESGPQGQDRAVGVRLADGTEHRADVVISAADGRATLFDMLKGRYVSDKVQSYYDEWPIWQPIVQVSVGVARDLSGQPHMLRLPLHKPIVIAGEEQRWIKVKHYGHDPTMAPKGKAAMAVVFRSNYAYWKSLSDEPERYEAEQQEIAVRAIERLETRFPGITDQVEVVDVATPLTFERYTGNWQGSIMGWLATAETMRMMSGKGMDQTLPGLEGFYMAGQWAVPAGGLPTAATSGRDVIRALCKQERKTFSASFE
jgi:phytoene dehydrogenase-like protein